MVKDEGSSKKEKADKKEEPEPETDSKQAGSLEENLDEMEEQVSDEPDAYEEDTVDNIGEEASGTEEDQHESSLEDRLGPEEKIIEEIPYFDVFSLKYLPFKLVRQASARSEYSQVNISEMYSYLKDFKPVEKNLESDSDAVARVVVSMDSDGVFEDTFSYTAILDHIRAKKLKDTYGIDNYVNPMKRSAHSRWVQANFEENMFLYDIIDV